jgi:hypothetical protein
MSTDAEILALIDAAFMSVDKPEHFTNFTHCEECAEHDEMLRSRDRESLRIEDVGNICWQPIGFSSPQGVAHFFPALARFALAEPTYGYGWYGDTLEIHLSANGSENKLLAYCNLGQRQAIAALLGHLNVSRADLEERMTTEQEMLATQALWLATP